MKFDIDDFEDWLHYEVELDRVTPDEKRFIESLIDTYLEEKNNIKTHGLNGD
tara:strand:- start:42 stop:197 length:156 start_codon:yes stop_codon:yes gene_type:complete